MKTTRILNQLKWKVESNKVEFHENGLSQVYPFIWLRDHDRSNVGYNHKTFQRKVPSNQMKIDLLNSGLVNHIRPSTPLTLNKINYKGNNIEFIWNDCLVTECPVELITQFIKDKPNQDSPLFDKLNQIWKGEELNDIIKQENIPSFADLMNPSSRQDVRREMIKVRQSLTIYLEHSLVSYQIWRLLAERNSIRPCIYRQSWKSFFNKTSKCFR